MRRPPLAPADLPPAPPGGTAGAAFPPARETSRMRSGHLPTRPYRLAAVTLGLGLGLSLLSGCSRDGYDESLIYPVRTDWVVNPNNNWEQQPTGFNHPGILPLDAL